MYILISRVLSMLRKIIYACIHSIILIVFVCFEKFGTYKKLLFTYSTQGQIGVIIDFSLNTLIETFGIHWNCIKWYTRWMKSYIQSCQINTNEVICVMTRKYYTSAIWFIFARTPQCQRRDIFNLHLLN